MTAPDERRTPEEIARECCGCRYCEAGDDGEIPISGTAMCRQDIIADAIRADRQHEDGGE